jgi:GSH-dependent disulfide-bond oxidoreductase
MIDLYFWPTPNGYKITLLLEELAIPFAIKRIDIGKGEQFDPAFLAISPNNRMPAIVDHAPNDGGTALSLFESGAILLYLSEKHHGFIPNDLRGRKTVLEWLFWQMGGLGPMLGQNHHFSAYAPEKIPYAIERYQRESRRLYGVLNKQLEGREYIAEQYSIADMACYPWTLYFERQAIDLNDYPNIKSWQARIGERPATVRAYAHGSFRDTSAPMSEEAKKILFGTKA